MFKLSDDDSWSTELEGKKLKKRGMRPDGEKLQIDVDSPALMEQVDVEQGQEFFTDRELQKENGEDREERLKKERLAARQQQLQLQKDQQQQQRVALRQDNPNLKMREAETGVMLSQNKGKPFIDTDFRQHGHSTHNTGIVHQAAEALKDGAEAVATVLVSGNSSKEASLPEPSKGLEGSIPATKLPDIRNKTHEMGM